MMMMIKVVILATMTMLLANDLGAVNLFSDETLSPPGSY